MRSRKNLHDVTLRWISRSRFRTRFYLENMSIQTAADKHNTNYAMTKDRERTAKRKAQTADSGPNKLSKIKGDFIKDVNRIPIDKFMSSHVVAGSLLYTPRPSTTNDSTGRHNIALDISFRVIPGPGRQIPPSRAIQETELEECFDLIKITSEDTYRPSSFGWHPRRKKREMRDPDMRYLLVRRGLKASKVPTPAQGTKEAKSESASNSSDVEAEPQNGEKQRPVLGFASFMLTYEDGYPVVYIYEIHLHPPLRSIGLGARLLDIVESIGRSVGVDKAMLTVFRSNETACNWYRKLEYSVDDYSPRDVELRGGVIRQADYLIMSKRLRKDKKEGE